MDYEQSIHFNFRQGTVGFEAVFADLPVDYDPAIYELDFRHEQLPADLSAYGGPRLTAHNRSDDLVMLVSRSVSGLQPSSRYRVAIEAEIASDVPSGCAGVGGSPGEGLYVKLGAAPERPIADADADNWLRLNVDFGTQSHSGAHGRVAGTLGNGHSCEFTTEAPWELLNFSTSVVMGTDADGNLWVLVGTDSAFEGFTQYYLTELRVRLQYLESAE